MKKIKKNTIKFLVFVENSIHIVIIFAIFTLILMLAWAVWGPV